MNIINKIFNLLKNFFTKKQSIKQLNSYKDIENKNNTNFINSIKVTSEKQMKQNKCHLNTLYCTGDGLGIQKKISF